MEGEHLTVAEEACAPSQRETLDKLELDGFDQCEVDEIHDEMTVSVGCSQCEALVLNGVPCHELGCPNWAEAKRAKAQREAEEELDDE